jgi:phosphatidate phosphatase APP1
VTVTWHARAASVENAVERAVGRFLLRRGWRPAAVVYPGYGRSPGDRNDGWVRVLARILLLPPTYATSDLLDGRGWRRFLTVSLPESSVTLEIGNAQHELVAGPGGYIDTVVSADLPPGTHQARIVLDGGASGTTGPVRVLSADASAGVVSDIDDTVVITALPRPLVAFWNTFVRRASARRPVPGMAEFLNTVADVGGFVVYLSTGAWNYAPVLRRFLGQHDYPDGPLLMTDWGPSSEHWFRSGQAHKNAELRRLHVQFPGVRWALVGDDGQHDPAIYDDFTKNHADAVRLIAIRTLTTTEQVLTHGTSAPPEQGSPAAEGAETGDGVPRLRGRDGHALLGQYLADPPVSN